MKIQAIIVDDEANSREILSNYLAKYCKGVQVVGMADSVAEALLLIENNEPQLVFLDVEMPYGNAFDFLDGIPERSFETVFVTAYEHYAKDALNRQAAYYLTKPIAIEELINSVDYVREIIRKEMKLQQHVGSPKQPRVSGKITLPQQDGFVVLDIPEILYCQADDNYTEIYLKTGSKKVVSKTLKYFEKILANHGFARIHKSYLVNVNEVVKYHKGKGGSVVVTNGVELLVSASKKKDFLTYFE